MGWATADGGPNAGISYYSLPRVLNAFAAPQAVSTETPLLAYTELGRDYADLVFTLRNHGVVQAAFYVDRSESGVAADADRQTVYVPAGAERRLECRDLLSLWWALAAAGDPDGGFPSVNVSWQLLARRRR